MLSESIRENNQDLASFVMKIFYALYCNIYKNHVLWKESVTLYKTNFKTCLNLQRLLVTYKNEP